MRHNEKSENIAQGRRSLVIASQAVGVVAVYRRHRRPNPFVSGQSFHFQMTVAHQPKNAGKRRKISYTKTAANTPRARPILTTSAIGSIS